MTDVEFTPREGDLSTSSMYRSDAQDVPPVTRAVMKASLGLVKTKRQADAVMVIISLACLVLAVYVWFR